MATYLGRNIVAMPNYPAPKSIEFARQNIVGASTSLFTGQQQIQDWGASWLEADVVMPPMITATKAILWRDFLIALKGISGVFQLTNPMFLSLVPAGLVPNGYWCLKNNTQKWSVTVGQFYGFEFEIREVL
jgi:hypothetical protein